MIIYVIDVERVQLSPAARGGESSSPSEGVTPQSERGSSGAAAAELGPEPELAA